MQVADVNLFSVSHSLKLARAIDLAETLSRVVPASSVDVTDRTAQVQELCESRGGRPGLSVLTSLLVSVDVKIY